MKNIFARLLVVCVCLLFSGCASHHQSANLDQPDEINDPYEKYNRYMFAVNDYLDTMVLRPVSYTYKQLTPKVVQSRVHDFLNNLRMPLITFNYLLQGNTEKASKAAGRFFTNSTVGLLGFIDVARYVGNEYDPTDYGITLGKKGVPSGPYVVLPIIGSSSVRDSVGKIATALTDPVNIYSTLDDKEWIPLVRLGADGVDFRAQNMETVDDLKFNSVDYYAKVRSLYYQKRSNMVSPNSRTHGDEDFPEYSELPNMEELER